MGIHALYRKPNSRKRHAKHPGYPYLLRNRSNHVWAADIVFIPMRRGFVYLFAVLDWASRRVLSWRTSNTLTTDFSLAKSPEDKCIEAVREAINRYGGPEIFNTDQGCQFTSLDFTGMLKNNDIQISIDGKGCWRDNLFVELNDYGAASSTKRFICMPTIA
jgi:putative transposase